MGDRYNVNIMQSSGDVLSFYSHNRFGGYFKAVARALNAARPRWNDESCFNRIVVSTLLDEVYGDSGGDLTTGSGISINRPALVEHSQVLIDLPRRMVYLFPQDIRRVEEFTRGAVKIQWSFDTFIRRFY